MNLDSLAYFLAKNLVEIPRIMLLVVVFLSTFCRDISLLTTTSSSSTTTTTGTFYPFAKPIAFFSEYFLVSFFTVWNITGVSYIASAMLEPKSAQLAMVILTLITVLFSGLDPRLSKLENSFFGMFISSMSQNRWMQESLYVQHTVKLEPAWKMLPTFYQNKGMCNYQLSFTNSLTNSTH